MKKVRDPIHGFIYPTETESKIIDSCIFQRLRKIKQLALTSLVYPGAVHTRFDHSLGVYHVASEMAKTVLSDEDDGKARIVRFAALLHDIGHGPFSHVSESLLDKYSGLATGGEKENIHEKLTVKLIETDSHLRDLISREERDRIIGLLSGEKVDLAVMREIVSGPIDADKIDYLLRDGFFCGVKYGVFDHHQLLSTFSVFENEGDKCLALRDDGKHALEQFVLAKYYMTTQVYRHKVRAISDAMITRGLELGIEEDQLKFLNKLYRYEDSQEYLENYLRYWDDRIINEIIYSEKKGYAKEIFERLHERRLFKRVFFKKYKDLNVPPEIKDILLDVNKDERIGLRKDLEEKISKISAIKCDKNFLILNKRSIKSIKDLSQSDEGRVLLLSDDGRKRRFEDESEVFSSINMTVKDETYLEVYCPVDLPSQNKIKIISEIEKEIYNILKSIPTQSYENKTHTSTASEAAQ